MTVFKDTRLLGTKAIQLAVKLARNEAIADEVNDKLNNGKVDVPSVLLPPVVVDKANIEKILIESGYLKREQVFKKAS